MSHKSLRARGRKGGGGHAEEHESSERWLVTYADMLTLLMVLFIVMFAMSQVDKKKFADLKVGLAKGFGATSAALADQSAPLDNGGMADTTVTAMDPGISPGLAGAKGDSKESKAEKAAKEQAQQAVAAEQ